jgi:hypothetical protein
MKELTKTGENMGNKIKITLPQRHIDFLSNQPERGMGYQVVDVTLKSGRILRKKLVFNSTFLQVEEEELSKCDEIAKIKLHRE